MKLLLLIILLIPVVCFSQETTKRAMDRENYVHNLRKGEKDTLIRVLMWCDYDLTKHGLSNEVRVEGWVKKDYATFSNPNSVIDYYDLRMRKIPKQYINRYQEK